MTKYALVGFCVVCVGCLEPAFAAPPVPSVPVNLEAEGGQNMVTLTWEEGGRKRSLAPSGTKIERAKSAGGPWTLIGMTVLGVGGLQDSYLEPGTTYYYRITAGGETRIVHATTQQ